MAIQTRTVVQAAVTKSAAFTPAGGGTPITALSGDSTLVLQVTSCVGGTATFHFQDAIDGTFTAFNPIETKHVVAGLKSRTYKFRKRDIPNTRFGVASATIRVILAQTTATAVTYSAWIE